MLDDITNQETPDYGYRRKRNEELEPEYLCQCRNCKEWLTDHDEVMVNNMDTFCSRECVAEFDRKVEDETV